MNKLKNLLHHPTTPTAAATNTSTPNSTAGGAKANKANNNERLTPEVGFKLVLDPGSSFSYDNGEADGDNNNPPPPQSTAVPELQVHLVGARHLPGSFGLKSVEGYMIKIKLFPGTAKFDSSIQTTSWPTFGETFRFPLAASHKSSFRVKKNQSKAKPDESPPEKLFSGNFVVFTVFALLELPPGVKFPSKLPSEPTLN